MNYSEPIETKTLEASSIPPAEIIFPMFCLCSLEFTSSESRNDQSFSIKSSKLITDTGPSSFEETVAPITNWRVRKEQQELDANER